MRARTALSLVLALASMLPLLSLTACACAPTGETDRDTALVDLAVGATTQEIPATIHVRSGTPQVEASVPNCAGTALASATIRILDASGTALPVAESGACTQTVNVTAAAGTDVDLRVVVTLPTAASARAMGDIDLVTFQDVCASVGASDIVSFGS